MEIDKRQELIAAQTMAAQALDAGARLAAKAAGRPVTGRGRAVTGNTLELQGTLLPRSRLAEAVVIDELAGNLGPP